MRTELVLLALAVVLGFLHIVVAAQAVIQQRGYRRAASSRDATLPPLTGAAGRLDRALKNFGETFPLFAAAVLLAHAAGKLSEASEIGAYLYLTARALYLPTYAFGIPYLRSFFWNVAAVGILLVLSTLL